MGIVDVYYLHIDDWITSRKDVNFMSGCYDLIFGNAKHEKQGEEETQINVT